MFRPRPAFLFLMGIAKGNLYDSISNESASTSLQGGSMTDTSGVDAKLSGLRERARHGLGDLFSPLVNWLEQRDVSPDQLSWLGFGLAILAALLAGFSVRSEERRVGKQCEAR